MRFSKSKWLAYTLFVGLIPILSRLIAWLTANADAINPIAAGDFIAFGLILHVSIINEIEHSPAPDKEWKTFHNGTSLVFFTWYGTLYALTLIGERNAVLVNADSLLRNCIVLAAISLVLSLLVFFHLSKRGAK